MSNRRIRFLFDFISHNAYLAWTQVHELAARHSVAVEPVPVLFAGLLKRHGQLGPAEIPGKNRWMLRDCLRKATRLGIDFRPPASHPFNPLVPLRAACVEMTDDRRRRLIDALFSAAWAEGLDVSQPAVVGTALTAAGLDGDSIVAAGDGADARAALRANTDRAIADGVFGVPTMLVDDQLFWGFDDFPVLEDYLAGADPLTPQMLTPWLDVKPSVDRRR